MQWEQDCQLSRGQSSEGGNQLVGLEASPSMHSLKDLSIYF